MARKLTITRPKPCLPPLIIASETVMRLSVFGDDNTHLFDTVLRVWPCPGCACADLAAAVYDVRNHGTEANPQWGFQLYYGAAGRHSDAGHLARYAITP